MEHIGRRIIKSSQDLWKFLKTSLLRKQKPLQLILFEEFLPFEKLARILGYKLAPKSVKSVTNLAKTNSGLVQILTVTLLVLNAISFVLCIKTEWLNIMIENFMFLGIFSVIILKIYTIFYKNLGKIQEVIENLDEYFAHSGVDQLELKVHKYLRNLRLFSRIIFIALNCVLIQYCLTPLLHQIYGWYMSIDVDLEHIFALYLSFDLLMPVIYPLIYIVTAWTMIFAVQFIACTELLFASLVEIIAMEFDILGRKISEIKVDEAEEEAIRRLKSLIDVHQELIEVSVKINEIFSLLQLCNAFGSISSLCVAYFLTVVTSTKI